jgi:hypothetical protein
MEQCSNSRIDKVYITWPDIHELQRAAECSGNILAQHTRKVTLTFISEIAALIDYGKIFSAGLLIFFLVFCLKRIVLPVIRRVGWSRGGSKEQAPSRTTTQ